jgi:Pyridoxamine 5'-phosphate oxidase
MTTWTDFAAAQPDLAERVRACFAVRKHATLATIRRDGSPRISGSEVEFSEEGLFLGSMAGAVKALDLQRDPRFALHCPTVDAVPGEESAWMGDAKLAGVATEVAPGPGGSHRFALDLLEVVHTRVGTPADHLVIESWHPDRGLRRIERR